jgi:hypothetical protein
MPSTYFKFKAHPGDLFRNAEEHELPDPDADLEAFLVWFNKGIPETLSGYLHWDPRIIFTLLHIVFE